MSSNNETARVYWSKEVRRWRLIFDEKRFPDDKEAPKELVEAYYKAVDEAERLGKEINEVTGGTAGSRLRYRHF